jgi:hypothetical protein
MKVSLCRVVLCWHELAGQGESPGPQRESGAL